MKIRVLKKLSALLAALLALTLTFFAVTGCSEKSDMKKNASGTAVALGHGNCVTEATVITDGFGRVKRVLFDDIFPASNVYNNTALGTDAEIVSVSGKDYYKYLRIGDKYFSVGENGIYSEIGATGGITDLMNYYKTPAGVRWYYESFLSGNLYVCKESEEGKAVGDVKLADKYKFNTQYGSMRKRYSRYWSTQGSDLGQVSGLGFVGNMDMLENYLLEYGFDAIGSENAIALPKSENNSSNRNVIGGVTTGATLSKDTAIYLNTAKEAYNKAMEAAK